MINFWWVRHAPVVMNNDCCYGNNEVECDVSDTKSLKSLIATVPFNCNVYTSSLSRTIKTFNAAVNLGYSYKKHIIDERLVEQNLGDYTGMKYNELYELTKKTGIYDVNWLMKASHKPPNGESFEQLSCRVKSFIDEILNITTNNNVVIFSHGGPIRAAISYALNYNSNDIIPLEIDNTKTSLISYNKHKKGKLIFLNK